MVDGDKYLSININALHEEAGRQAELFSEHAKLKAEADKEADEAKNHLKLVTANMDKEIRDDPAKYGIIKITEDQVKNIIVRQPQYQRAAKALIEKEYHAAIHATNVDALRQKKDMITDLVKLRLADYFADPVLPQQGEVDKAMKADVRSRGRK